MSLVSRTRRPCRSTGAQRGSRLDGLSPSSRMLRGCARMLVLQRFSSRSFADARNENAPGVRVRGRLLPRKIGATDLPWRGRSVRAVQAFVATARHRRARERRGAAMPLHVFLGDCDVVAHGRRSVRDKEDGRELYARKISLARPFVVLRTGNNSRDRSIRGDRCGHRTRQSSASAANNSDVSITRANSARKVARCAALIASAARVPPAPSSRSKQKHASATTMVR